VKLTGPTVAISNAWWVTRRLKSDLKPSYSVSLKAVKKVLFELSLMKGKPAMPTEYPSRTKDKDFGRSNTKILDEPWKRSKGNCERSWFPGIIKTGIPA
jgi:hypothetical protein